MPDHVTDMTAGCKLVRLVLRALVRSKISALPPVLYSPAACKQAADWVNQLAHHSAVQSLHSCHYFSDGLKSPPLQTAVIVVHV